MTGAAIDGRRLYAISAAFSTLLTIDLDRHTVVAAHAVPGIAKPVGIAVKGGELYILGENGTVWVVGRPRQ